MSPLRRETPPPRPLRLSYAAHLPRLSAEALKRFARIWVGREASRLNKEACIQAICQGLTNPAVVRRVVADLSDFERAGLGLLKRYGQSAPTEVLATELLMLGLPSEDHRAHHASWSARGGADYQALNCLLHRGIAMLLGRGQEYGGDIVHVYVDDYHYSPTVFAEPCLLEHVTPVPPVPLSLEPVSEMEPGIAKQPAEVVLRLIAMIETLRKMGRIPLTSRGRPTRPFLSKLTKTLGWEAAFATDALAPLPDATLFFFWLLAGLGFYQPLPDNTGLDLIPETTPFFEASYEAQAARWVCAYRTLTGWIEHRPELVWGDDTEAWYFNKFIGLRAALLLALAALPEATAWYRIADLSTEIYSRLGEHFSLGYLPHFYPLYRATPAQVAQKRQEWQQQLFKSWQRTELPWILSAMTGPLVHLGLVELACAPGQKRAAPTLFSLTHLGRVVLYDALRSFQSSTVAAPAVARLQHDERCWVVQPNFDVVVYLDRASATHLAFIERIAERKPSTGATALYHLTRDAVYAALESGIAARTLYDTLHDASAYPLPDNVQQMLQEWAARRERLTVYRTADLVEFADQAARDAALATQALAGQPVGERFIVLSRHMRHATAAASASRAVDYCAAPVRCLQVAEDGTVHIRRTHADLLVRGEVAAWADPGADEDHWRLTRTSVQRAVKAGWTAASMIENLSQRAQQPVPALLIVAIRAWAGERALPKAVAVASDMLLQIADPTVAHAIATSTLLQPYLRGQLGPQTFLVRRDTASELQRQLVELGLHVGSDLLLGEQ
jgi:Helicase conserved C-terminal domain